MFSEYKPEKRTSKNGIVKATRALFCQKLEKYCRADIGFKSNPIRFFAPDLDGFIRILKVKTDIIAKAQRLTDSKNLDQASDCTKTQHQKTANSTRLMRLI